MNVRCTRSPRKPVRSRGRQPVRTGDRYERHAALHSDQYQLAGNYSPSREPLPVPSTAIYTRGDGVVAWHTCAQRVDHQSENIEVRGSHCGLGHHPPTVLTMLDRLAQPEDGWRPFRPPVVVQH